MSIFSFASPKYLENRIRKKAHSIRVNEFIVS